MTGPCTHAYAYAHFTLRQSENPTLHPYLLVLTFAVPSSVPCLFGTHPKNHNFFIPNESVFKLLPCASLVRTRSPVQSWSTAPDFSVLSFPLQVLYDIPGKRASPLTRLRAILGLTCVTGFVSRTGLTRSSCIDENLTSLTREDNGEREI